MGRSKINMLYGQSEGEVFREISTIVLIECAEYKKNGILYDY